jgi:hypothetical protein
MAVPLPDFLPPGRRLATTQDAHSLGLLSRNGRGADTDFRGSFSGSVEIDSFVSRNDVPYVSCVAAGVAPEPLEFGVIRSRGETVPVEGALDGVPAPSGIPDVTTSKSKELDDIGLAPKILAATSSDGRQSSSNT